MTPEIDHYLQFFVDQHRHIDELIKDLPLDALNWQPLTSGDGHATNSLAVLLMHVTGAEQFWVGELLGQHQINRDREAEFRAVAIDVASLRRRLQETDELVREVLTTVDPARLDKTVQLRGHTLTLRWGVIHMIEHTAQHLGHMQLTLQLWRDKRAAQQ
jgi:uncharacterized damage-inducible protein DinB